MSVFFMKLLAVLSMLIDHTGFFLRQQFHIGDGLYYLMRSLGRFAFPVYCFLIVNGFEKTSDRRKYLTRLSLFAAISQLPFSLAFCAVNYTGKASVGLAFAHPLVLVVPALLCVIVCWYKAVRPDITALIPAAALLLGITYFSTDGVYLLYPNMNVFYTLAVSLALILVLDRLSQPDSTRSPELLFGILGVAAALLLIRNRSDYGYLGILLPLLLWATRGSRKGQCLALLLWCWYEYLLSHATPEYFIAAALAVVPILLYNGRLGRPFRNGFYIIYPAHLLLLGALVILI